MSAVKARTQEGVPYRELFSFPLFLSHPCPAFPGLFLTLVIILPLSLSVTAPQPLFWLGEVLSLTGLTYLPSPWIPTLSLSPRFLHPTPLRSDSTCSMGCRASSFKTSESSQGKFSSSEQPLSSLESQRFPTSHPTGIWDELPTPATPCLALASL